MHHTGGHRAYERDAYENAGEKTKCDEQVDRSHDSAPHAARAQFPAKNAWSALLVPPGMRGEPVRDRQGAREKEPLRLAREPQ